MNRTLLAGKIADLGNSWIETLKTWGDKGLTAVLIVIVVITVARRMSLKAGIGALLAMVLALGIYNARGTLSDYFKDEVDHPAKSAPASTTPTSTTAVTTAVVAAAAPTAGSGR